MSADLRGRIVDFEKLILFTDSTEPGKRARMQFGGRDGNFRITVFTGTGSTAKEGVIQCPLDPMSFDSFLTLFESIIRGESGSKSKITAKTLVYENDKPTDQMKVMSELWFGKNAEGIVWIALSAPSYPKLTFEFRGSRFAEFYQKDGTPLSDQDLSKLTAGSFVRVLRDTMPAYIMALSAQPRVAGGAAGVPSKPAAKLNNDTFEDLSY